MTVALELEADPPYLRRDDGLIVRFPSNNEGGFPVIEIGRRRGDDEFGLVLCWRGCVYQELQPGGEAALLVGHIPGGGYCSAVVTVSADGVSIEFADRLRIDADGLQRLVVEYTIQGDAPALFETPNDCAMTSETDNVSDAVRRQIQVERTGKPGAIVSRLLVSLPT